MVSVCVQTYQHASFIREALDSILIQQTDFEFEILIGEDESTDGTREICVEYSRNYHQKIRLFLNSRKNVIYINGHPTGRWNIVNNLKNARGKYIALLPGDDYWTDPLKLQKQVDFMDHHPQFSSCFHWAGWLLDNTGQIKHWNYGPPVIKSFYTVDDLFEHSNFIPTCSVLFRNNLFNKFPDWYFLVEVGDYPLHILNTQYGAIGFLNEKMAVRRWHSKGIYGGSKRSENFKRTIRTFDTISINLNLQKNIFVKIGKARLYCKLAKAHKQDGEYRDALLWLINSITEAPLQHKITMFRSFFRR